MSVHQWNEHGNKYVSNIVLNFSVFKVGRAYNEGVIYSYAYFDVLADGA
jgi:hypothetical protein